MIRMNVNRILPLMLLLVLFASCSRKYKVEGVSSVTSLDGKMLYLKTLRDGQWIFRRSGTRFVLYEWSVGLCNDGDALHE